jgi:hypothetical protein
MKTSIFNRILNNGYRISSSKKEEDLAIDLLDSQVLGDLNTMKLAAQALIMETTARKLLELHECVRLLHELGGTALVQGHTPLLMDTRSHEGVLFHTEVWADTRSVAQFLGNEVEVQDDPRFS